MRQALVLGGGGIIGVAWESGLLSGLAEGGVELDAFEIVVGTSAGAIVGARVASGLPPSAQDDPPSEREAEPRESAIQPGKLDLGTLGNVFKLWGAMERGTPEKTAEIGAMARDLYRDREEDWVTSISTVVRVDTWPDKRLLIASVDTASGERRFFDRDSGVHIGRAAAASSAIPAIAPSITIDGKRYMDGQVWSSTHADALLGEGYERVLVAMPTNAHTAPGIGAHAQRAIDHEAALLREQGVQVELRAPAAEDAARWGPNLMDPTNAPIANEIGVATGRVWAEALR